MTLPIRNLSSFFIDGAWVSPTANEVIEVINPSNEDIMGHLALGQKADVDRAVAAARKAFKSFSTSTRAERIALLERIAVEYEKRHDDMAMAISQEMGAPLQFARDEQAASGLAHIQTTIEALRTFAFEHRKGTSLVVKEPIGVVGLITPWNWPANLIAVKVASAIAAGCTVVIKPSEIAPLSGIVFAEILAAAEIPQGVFNLVNGNAMVGDAIARHPEIDMVSFTGSTPTGILVAKAAADTVKRIHQELGGKGPNILLPDADFETAVAQGVDGLFANSGQTCSAPSRMLVPRNRRDDVVHYAKAAAERWLVGPADSPETTMGPVVDKRQMDKINQYIECGISEGATLVTGGPGRPPGLNSGYYVNPTVFADVTPQMRIANEEIFGPVLAIISYESIDEAVEIANDSVFGLTSYVQSSDIDLARSVARRMRTGQVKINNPSWDPHVPFGGYKQSGNGREQVEYGLDEYLELKAMIGYG